jgi:hypothetical protein
MSARALIIYFNLGCAVEVVDGSRFLFESANWSDM